MNDVIVTAREFDLRGTAHIVPLGSSAFGETRRRVARAQTLDGGVAINDFGHAYGDRTIRLDWRSFSPDLEARMERLVRLHAYVSVSCAAGIYLAAPESYSTSGRQSTASFLVVARMDEEQQ